MTTWQICTQSSTLCNAWKRPTSETSSHQRSECQSRSSAKSHGPRLFFFLQRTFWENFICIMPQKLQHLLIYLPKEMHMTFTIMNKIIEQATERKCQCAFASLVIDIQCLLQGCLVCLCSGGSRDWADQWFSRYCASFLTIPFYHFGSSSGIKILRHSCFQVHCRVFQAARSVQSGVQTGGGRGVSHRGELHEEEQGKFPFQDCLFGGNVSMDSKAQRFWRASFTRNRKPISGSAWNFLETRQDAFLGDFYNPNDKRQNKKAMRVVK